MMKQNKQQFLNKWNFLIQEDMLNNLTVDYLTYPIARGQKPQQEDLRYLYLILNLPLQCLCDYFNVSITTIGSWCKYFGIKKSKQQAQEVIKQMNLQKYGVENTSQLEKVKQKRKETNLQKYGVDNVAKTSLSKQKTKQTCELKYGQNNPMKVQKFKDKQRQTTFEKFGVEISTQSEQVKDKLRQKVPQMLEKSKQTCKERYDTEYSLQNKQIRQKGKETCLRKYGKACYSGSQTYYQNLNTLCEHNYQTKKQNASLNSSHSEDMAFTMLFDRFGTDVKRHYKNEQYPFVCDFYIESLDLYIEYQGFIAHGKEPYNPENVQHLKIVEQWKKKVEEINFKGHKKQFYENCITTWTKRDPLKRKTAKENNLNWIEFFSLQELKSWLESV